MTGGGAVPVRAATATDAPDWWRTRIGSALMVTTVDRQRDLGWSIAVLWTAEDNQPARRAYEANGWAPDGAAQQAVHTGAPVPSVRYRRSF